MVENTMSCYWGGNVWLMAPQHLAWAESHRDLLEWDREEQHLRMLLWFFQKPGDSRSRQTQNELE